MKQKKQDTKGKDDGENDLPPELSHLDPELVSKIESEICDTSKNPTTFDDIAGLESAKRLVRELVIWPVCRPDLFTGLRAAPRGLLLFGPPGTGKTMIGKAIAGESGSTFFAISSSSLTSKWIGEGEKLVRSLFAVAAYRSPSVVFIDEVDSILTARRSDENEASRRMKTEILVQLDGASNPADSDRVLVVGATNRPQELDDAARRRFTKRIYIPLPDEKGRGSLLHSLLGMNKNDLTTENFSRLTNLTDGYSGADLRILCGDAANGPIRDMGSLMGSVAADDVPAICWKHVKKALKKTKPSVNKDDLEQYQVWNREYGGLLEGEDSEDDDDDTDDEQQRKKSERDRGGETE